MMMLQVIEPTSCLKDEQIMYMQIDLETHTKNLPVLVAAFKDS